MDQEIKDRIENALNIPEDVQRTLDAGSNHDYHCTCETCLQWWVQMGPDGGEAGNYGPFEEEQVRAACIAAGMKWPECHAMSEEQ